MKGDKQMDDLYFTDGLNINNIQDTDCPPPQCNCPYDCE